MSLHKVVSLSRVQETQQKKHMSIVLAREAREGPYSQDQARRLMAETGHHLEETAGNSSSSVPAGLEGIWCDPHRLDLSSVFMTVGFASMLTLVWQVETR